MNTAVRVVSTKLATVGTFYFFQSGFQAILRNGQTEFMGRLSLRIRYQVTHPLNVQDCYQLLRTGQGLAPSLVVILWEERPPKPKIAVTYPLKSENAAWEFDIQSGDYQLTVSVSGPVINNQVKLEVLIITCLKIILAATYSCQTHGIVVLLKNRAFNRFVADQ